MWFWGKVGFRGFEKFVKTFELVNTSFLKVRHEHVLPQNDNLRQCLFERTVIKNDAADWMRAFNLLNLFALSIGVLDLLSELRNIHPVIVYNVFDKFLLSFVLPK